jgi:hypothetical protein
VLEGLLNQSFGGTCHLHFLQEITLMRKSVRRLLTVGLIFRSGNLGGAVVRGQINGLRRGGGGPKDYSKRADTVASRQELAMLYHVAGTGVMFTDTS